MNQLADVTGKYTLYISISAIIMMVMAFILWGVAGFIFAFGFASMLVFGIAVIETKIQVLYMLLESILHAKQQNENGREG